MAGRLRILFLLLKIIREIFESGGHAFVEQEMSTEVEEEDNLQIQWRGPKLEEAVYQEHKQVALEVHYNM